MKDRSRLGAVFFYNFNASVLFLISDEESVKINLLKMDFTGSPVKVVD